MGRDLERFGVLFGARNGAFNGFMHEDIVWQQISCLENNLGLFPIRVIATASRVELMHEWLKRASGSVEIHHF